MRNKLRVVVTGLAATYPLGGVFWDYLQYPLGLLHLGHDVLYLEDTGKWFYDPYGQTLVENGEKNVGLLAAHIARLDPTLKDRWFVRDGAGKTYGRSWRDVAGFCRSADLFIHVSAGCNMRDEYFSAANVAFIDSDPMYTQASVPGYLAGDLDVDAGSRIDLIKSHDSFFTFGENLGKDDCTVPSELFNWVSTRQPIVLECFRNAAVPVRSRRRALTTIASWEPCENPLVVNGRVYRGKSVEFERFITLPSRSVLPLELAVSGRFPRKRFLEQGWLLRDPLSVSSDPWLYLDHLASSFGEWSVAKNAYVTSRSGWFSCRTACYLALGVPVIVQDTGFSKFIPTGHGVQSFSTLEEAAEAIREIASEPERHSRAALEIAHEYFDSRKVLHRLLETAGAGR